MLTIDLSTEVLFTQLDLAGECENFEAMFEWCIDRQQYQLRKRGMTQTDHNPGMCEFGSLRKAIKAIKTSLSVCDKRKFDQKGI